MRMVLLMITQMTNPSIDRIIFVLFCDDMCYNFFHFQLEIDEFILVVNIARILSLFLCASLK